MIKWHPHKPGDPMPVDGETMVVVRLRNGETDVDRAGQYSWDDECGYSIDAYRYANPADEPQPAPERRWISVAEQPHPIGGGVRFWARWRGYDGVQPVRAWTCHAGITHWCPMEQPPEFVDPPAPLTDAEKLTIAVEALKEVHAVYEIKTVIKALAKIEGEK